MFNFFIRISLNCTSDKRRKQPTTFEDSLLMWWVIFDYIRIFEVRRQKSFENVSKTSEFIIERYSKELSMKRKSIWRNLESKSSNKIEEHVESQTAEQVKSFHFSSLILFLYSDWSSTWFVFNLCSSHQMFLSNQFENYSSEKKHHIRFKTG